MYNIITAVDSNNVIGENNKLAYNIPEDLRNFRRITMSTKSGNKMNALIMGRKTWESIGCRSLPGRLNCVISNTLSKKIPYVWDSFEECLEYLEKLPSVEKIFVIGGGEIFKKAIEVDKIDTIYLTKIQNTQPFENPIYFPDLPKKFEVVSSKEFSSFSFLTYKNIL
tara:strand:+ start:1139 stop:1639 length:501 start_codon:yes stop_codon:yes gene_type:complete